MTRVTPTTRDHTRVPPRGMLTYALVIGAAQIGYLLALREQIADEVDGGWVLGVFVGAVVAAVAAWVVLVVHAFGPGVDHVSAVLPWVALSLGVTALGVLVALLVLQLSLDIGGALLALGALAEATATVVLVCLAWMVRGVPRKPAA
jgi:hypothetical protein